MLPVGVAIIIPGKSSQTMIVIFTNESQCLVNEVLTISLNRGHFTSITGNDEVSEVWIGPTIHYKIIHNLHNKQGKLNYANVNTL